MTTALLLRWEGLVARPSQDSDGLRMATTVLAGFGFDPHRFEADAPLASSLNAALAAACPRPPHDTALADAAFLLRHPPVPPFDVAGDMRALLASLVYRGYRLGLVASCALSSADLSAALRDAGIPGYISDVFHADARRPHLADAALRYPVSGTLAVLTPGDPLEPHLRGAGYRVEVVGGRRGTVAAVTGVNSILGDGMVSS